ncbi:hypothetical protein [Streptomyces purpurascens]
MVEGGPATGRRGLVAGAGLQDLLTSAAASGNSAQVHRSSAVPSTETVSPSRTTAPAWAW